MRLKLIVVSCLAMLTIPIIGCNGGGGTITVSDADTKELDDVRTLELARANYGFRLGALIARYRLTGNMQRQIWAQRELKNLNEAHTVKFKGFGRVVMPDAKALDEADEVLLVELTVAARQDYRAAIAGLQSHYDGLGDEEKIRLIRGMFEKFDPVRTYMYYLSAEIPAKTLVASDDVAEANAAFEASLRHYAKSRSLLAFGAKVRKARHEALVGLRGLVRSYPTSSKIGRSAFFIAEIYRSLDEPARAAVWYDRAFQWDAALPDPARYRAATLYDHNRQMRDPAKARRYYKMAVASEPSYTENARNARLRIKELTPEK